jgi:tetratricopeptide (TPR) repeat protein
MKICLFFCLSLVVLFTQGSLYAQKTFASLVRTIPPTDCSLMLDSLPKAPAAFKEGILKSISKCVVKGSTDEGRLNRQYALFHFGAARYKEAIEWSKKEQLVYEKLGDIKKSLSAQLICTQFYMSFGDGFRAHRIAKHILHEAERLRDTSVMASAYLSLGMSCKEPKDQIKYYHRALNYAARLSIPNFSTMGTVHNNLALSFERSNVPDSARYHYQQAINCTKRCRSMGC